jgi:hypothetical protein
MFFSSPEKKEEFRKFCRIVNIETAALNAECSFINYESVDNLLITQVIPQKYIARCGV